MGENMDRKIQLIAADLDGTLMNEHKEISYRNWKAIEQAAKKGVETVLATGRTLAVIPQNIAEHPLLRYGVCSNGAAVIELKTGKIIYHNSLSKEKVMEILKSLKGRDIHIDVFADGQAYTRRREEGLLVGYGVPEWMRKLVIESRTQVDDFENFVINKAGQVERLNIFYKTKEEKEWLKEVLSQDKELAVVSSLFMNLEISSVYANKGNGLQWLAGHLGISMEQVMALGDSDNDITMLRMAGLGVAMENAAQEIKEAADEVTSSNEEDGVAQAIERWVLGW